MKMQVLPIALLLCGLISGGSAEQFMQQVLRGQHTAVGQISELLLSALKQQQQQNKAEPIWELPPISIPLFPNAQDICVNASTLKISLEAYGIDFVFDMLSDFEVHGLSEVALQVILGIKDLETMEATLDLRLAMPNFRVLGDLNWTGALTNPDDPDFYFVFLRTEGLDTLFYLENFWLGVHTALELWPFEETLNFTELSVGADRDNFTWIGDWFFEQKNATHNTTIEGRVDLGATIIEPLVVNLWSLLNALLKIDAALQCTLNHVLGNCSMLDLAEVLDGTDNGCIQEIGGGGCVGQLMMVRELFEKVGTLGYHQCPTRTSEDVTESTTGTTGGSTDDGATNPGSTTTTGAPTTTEGGGGGGGSGVIPSTWIIIPLVSFWIFWNY